MSYTPRPLDTEHVAVPADLHRLAEDLARHIHDVWAQRRLAEGWTYGPERNDPRKQHPDLVPYEDLPPGEQAYDHATAMGTIRALLALGYTLTPPSAAEPAVPEEVGGEPAVRVREVLGSPDGRDLGALVQLWRTRDEAWAASPEPYQLLAERFLSLGEPLLAYDVAKEGRERFPVDPRLRQRLALASARGGAPEAALELIDGLRRDGHLDQETLGLLGRVYKDLWEQAVGTPAAADLLVRAAETYESAYRATGGYWTAINAATLWTLAGQVERGRELARAVQEQCRPAVAQAVGRDEAYWLHATLAEAALVLGQGREAEQQYAAAVALGAHRVGDLASTRRNAHLLLRATGQDATRIDALLRVPRVAVFAGHMIDGPDQPAPRFPAAIESEVYQAIRRVLADQDCKLGYASAASGADILFHEALAELEGESHVVLPYDPDAFARDSVDPAGEGAWRERFERVLDQSVEVVAASSQQGADSPVVLEYANAVQHGLAALHAAALRTELVPIAVWDGRPGNGPGGTADSVARWRAAGLHVHVIDPTRFLPPAAAGPRPSRRPGRAAATQSSAAPDAYAKEVVSMLFADAVGFSKLSEEAVPLFVRHFLGAVGRLTDGLDERPLMANTWGDGLFFVFASTRDAGVFALDLTRLVQATDWAAYSLPGLSLRIGLHAGPAYRLRDPVTRLPNFAGAQVSRAARIEPITPPGHVYASREFAAVATADGVREFTCAYAGQVPMAKGYGTFPTYHVYR